jgi:hypothetical protein
MNQNPMGPSYSCQETHDVEKKLLGCNVLRTVFDPFHIEIKDMIVILICAPKKKVNPGQDSTWI